MADAGALAGVAWLSATGLVVYLAALGLWGRMLWQPLRTEAAHRIRTGVGGRSHDLARHRPGLGRLGAGELADWASVREAFIWPAAALGAGFGVQLLTGALSYLLPSVLGGGPSVVRAGQRWFNAGAGFRLVAINGGLLLWLAPTPSWVKVTGSLLALCAAAAFLPIMIAGTPGVGGRAPDASPAVARWLTCRPVHPLPRPAS